MSFLSWLNPIGKTIGAVAQQKAQNRGEKLSSQMDLEQILMARDQEYFNQRVAREQEGRESGSDAWRKMLASQHTLDPGPRPQLSKYSVAPRMPNENERIAATALSEEAAHRLIEGNKIPQVIDRPLEIDRNLMNPGKFERIAGWLAPLLTFGGSQLSQPRMPSARVSGAGNINSGLYGMPSDLTSGRQSGTY